MIYGIGIDLCSVERVAKVHKKFGRRLEWRLLSPREQEAGPPSDARLARRFAAKEAVAKALGCGIGERLSFQDMSIVRGVRGRPVLELSPRAQANFPGVEVYLSMTYEQGWAAANAVAVVTESLKR
jgi:holo-[acyl-carrier protein] synthase